MTPPQVRIGSGSGFWGDALDPAIGSIGFV